MTPRERVLKAIAHEETDIVPYLLAWDGEIDKALVQYYGGEEWRKRIVNHYAVASPILPGLTGERLPDGTARDIFGGRWEFKNIFHLIEPPLKEPSLEHLVWPDVSDDANYAPLYDTCRRVPDRFTIGAFALGLFERSWALRGMTNILMDMAGEPEFCEELYAQITAWNIKIFEKICDSPVDAVGFTDDLGCQNGLIMGPHYWKKYLKPHMAEMFGYIKSRGKYTYLHSCGDNSEIMGDLVDMGLDIFNPLQPEPWDIFAVKRQYGAHITLNGGISSQTTLPFGTPEQVRQETLKCLRELGAGGGYIAEPNKPIMPGTPVENAVMLIETLVNQPH